MIWHSSSLDELNEDLQTNYDKGLSDAIANYRLKDFNENFSHSVSVTPFINKFLALIKQPMVILLLVSAVVFYLIELLVPSYDKKHLSIAIGVVLFIVALLFAKAAISYLCERVMAHEQKITAPKAVVIRGGVEKVINSTQVVPGDLIVLRPRYSVPADARLLKTENLTCNESAVTGVQAPIVKDCDYVCTDITPLTQRANMVYAGSWVSHGYGLAVVTETGDETEFGKRIAIEREPALSDIEVSFAELKKLLSQISAVVFVLLLLIFFLVTRFSKEGDGLTLLSIFTHVMLVSSAVSVLLSPIGITETATISTLISLIRLKKNNVSVTNTSIIDEMGSVNCICIDKSAVTVHNMVATEIYNGIDILDITGGVSSDTAMLLRLAAAASLDDGDTTDKALIAACEKHTGINKAEMDNLYPRLSYVPFDNESMTTVSVNMIDGQPYAIVKGAAETIADFCTGETEHILNSADAMGTKALHVVAVAVKMLSSVSDTVNPSKDELFGGLTFLGLIGLTDPIRDDVRSSIMECTDSNIKVVLFTGDSISTAKAIARQAGILNDDQQAILGIELENLNDEEFLDVVLTHTTFARITPALRIRIIQTLKDSGYIISATGRSPTVNAAMDTANIGCALGESGSDAVKRTADVVLKDDSFKSIVSMIKCGRSIYENIRRSIGAILTVNIALVIIEFFGYLIWQTSVFSSVQMLMTCLLTNILSILLISFEPFDSLKNSDNSYNNTNLSSQQKINVIWHSVVLAVVVLVCYAICGINGAEVANFGGVFSFVAAAVTSILGFKSGRSILNTKLFSNKTALITVIAVFIVTFVFASNAAFGIGGYIPLLVLLSLLPLVAIEAGKIIITYKRSK